MPRETQKEINSMFQYVFDKAAESGRNDVLRAKEALRKTKIEDALRDQKNKLNVDIEVKRKISALINSEKYDEAQKLIDKHQKKSITLKKIPKVPKVPTKKLLKDIPEFDLTMPPKIKKYTPKPITLKKIPEFDLTIPPKIKSVQQTKVSSKKMIKSDKVLKELDELMKDVDKIIAEHTKANKPKMMTKKAEKDIIQRVNNEIEEVSKMVKLKSTKPKAEPKPKAVKRQKQPSVPAKQQTEEEKLANREAKKEATRLRNMEKKENEKRIKAEERAALMAAKKEATRLRNIEKKENEKRIKAEAKIKLAAHKKEAEANLEKMNAIRARRSEELDELKNDFNMFRRYANYLPEADKLASLTPREIETAQNNLANAEDYINNAVSSYKKYKKEGLVHKEDLDLLMAVYEVEQCVAKVKQVKEVLKK
jgi:hypothetical protein